jgi:hypothetical protein
VKDRRLAEARLELTGRPGAPIGFAARPTYGTVGWADLSKPGEMPTLRYLKPLVSSRAGGTWLEATAELVFHQTPREELADVGLQQVTSASVGWLGITITGATEA